jgi:aspartate/methionine/tyrosine aminotransferase
MERLLVNSTSCVPAFVQLGAVAALTGPMDAVDDMVSEFSLRRKLLIDGLNALPGVSCAAPSGAFYAFPNVSGTGFSGEDLATRLLETAGVATVPGSAFGREASAHLRLSYANSRENLGLALQRIGALLEHAV